MIELLLLLLFPAQIELPALIREIAASGRVLEIAAEPSKRLNPPPEIAPGAPPLLSFRLLDGKQRHRYGNLDLMLDDAGH